MSFSKAFNEDERLHILRNHGWMTAGDIAKELNHHFYAYNEGKRTADGVRRYIAEMTGAKVEVELPREIEDQLKVNGHDPAKVQADAQKAANAFVAPLIQKPLSKHRAKA